MEHKSQADKKSDYLVRQDSTYEFTITKWEDGSEPESEYHVVKKGSSFSCDCPAALRGHACKHQDVLSRWIRDGKKEGHMIEATTAFSSAQIQQHKALWHLYQVNREKMAPNSPEWHFENNGDKLHEIYFETLGSKPNENGYPALFKKFVKLGMTRGIGWVSLEIDAMGKPMIRWINMHDSIPERPVLLLDCWEHAYMVDFQATQRKDYIQKWWNYIDWNIVMKRLQSYQGVPSQDSTL